MLIPFKTYQQLPILVTLSSKSVFICNRFHPRSANSGKKRLFRGYRSATPSARASLNLGDRNLNCWNLSLMLKISKLSATKM